jgi:hypothetical protein
VAPLSRPATPSTSAARSWPYPATSPPELSAGPNNLIRKGLPLSPRPPTSSELGFQLARPYPYPPQRRRSSDPQLLMAPAPHQELIERSGMSAAAVRQHHQPYGNHRQGPLTWAPASGRNGRGGYSSITYPCAPFLSARQIHTYTYYQNGHSDQLHFMQLNMASSRQKTTLFDTLTLVLPFW